jgi:hypothetical protein
MPRDDQGRGAARAVCQPSAWYAEGVLEGDRLVAAVVERTGLDDFGDEGWKTGFDVLLESANGEAQLSDIGELILGEQVERSLDNRLQVTDWHRSHPDLAATAVARPVFILGLPRTGTTLLSYLLDADPANRSLLRWEAFTSVPPPDPSSWRDDPRLARAAMEMDALYAAAPEFKAIHYEAADGPTECVTLLGQEMRSVHFETLANLPSYGEWHLACDMRPAYEWHRSVLQVLQSAWPGRWVLKSPCHNLALDALAAVYPDAVFVATHRDPVTVVASLANLVSVLSGLGTDHDFDEYIERRWLDLASLMIDRFMAARSNLGEHRFYDIDYRDLVGDPIGTVSTLYDGLGWELTPETLGRFRSYLDANPQGKHGRHDYSLDQFGLTEHQIRERFADYCVAFDL